jgi:hypothetical protein
VVKEFTEVKIEEQEEKGFEAEVIESPKFIPTVRGNQIKVGEQEIKED